MKIIIDSAIPFVRGVFEPFCSVEYIEGSAIDRKSVKDATALLIRTRTRCNRELLEGSSVQHIATATIGFDHIDTQYCREHHIEVSTAAGCNARAVLQWVGAVLAQIAQREGWQPRQRTIGVVGVGSVGGLVSHYAELWGFNVLRCDPPRQAREGGDFVSFEELASKAGIITLHTPLNADTRHLINAQSLQLISPHATIINSSRGEVVDSKALVESGKCFVLDVWESEPNIDPQALQESLLATAHVAGYSLQGKANASSMAVQSIAKALNLPLTSWQSDVESCLPRAISWESLLETIGAHFDIVSQSDFLKSNRGSFEAIRDNYEYRKEYF